MDGVETPGQLLRATREHRGLTIKELATITRITPRFIQCLEEDRYDEIPGEVFVRGFLRNYAREVEIDPAEIIRHYESFTGQTQRKDGFNGSNLSEPHSMDALLAPSRLPKLSLILAIIAIILGLGLSILIFDSPDAEELSNSVQQTTDETWHRDTP